VLDIVPQSVLGHRSEAFFIGGPSFRRTFGVGLYLLLESRPQVILYLKFAAQVLAELPSPYLGGLLLGLNCLDRAVSLSKQFELVL
jgi:hypothetical protein